MNRDECGFHICLSIAVRQDLQVLKLKTEDAGTLEIDWAYVSEVILSEPGKSLLDDDTVIESRTRRPSGTITRPSSSLRLRCVFMVLNLRS